MNVPLFIRRPTNRAVIALGGWAIMAAFCAFAVAMAPLVAAWSLCRKLEDIGLVRVVDEAIREAQRL